LDGIQQVIYENNACIGNSATAGGSNIATYSGGYSHHLYLGGSTYEHAYGNDRETMTYDDAGSVYYGIFHDISNTTGANVLKTPGGNFSTVGGPKRNAQYNFGKAIVVANGKVLCCKRAASVRCSNSTCFTKQGTFILAFS
jgi:hypothetical protein